MLDINKTLDLVKLKFFNEWLYTSHLYDEGETDLHKNLTAKVVESYFDPLNLDKKSAILDVGCATGYFLDEAKSRGYDNVVGITLSEANAAFCRSKGHTVKEWDPTFLPQADGFWDESVDFIFCRHYLQHSPYPIFSLVEYNRLLKLNGKMYVEVPAPDCDRRHEYNPNHYSVMGVAQLDALFARTGFKVDKFNELEFDVTVQKLDDETTTVKERYYCFVLTKTAPLDIK
jgi:cyclopropane fatty-acyl-phospholipid synthase-like methyltransferase